MSRGVYPIDLEGLAEPYPRLAGREARTETGDSLAPGAGAATTTEHQEAGDMVAAAVRTEDEAVIHTWLPARCPVTPGLPFPATVAVLGRAGMAERGTLRRSEASRFTARRLDAGYLDHPLNAARRRRGLSFDAVGAWLGIGGTSVYAWIDGREPFPPKHAPGLALLFGTTADEVRSWFAPAGGGA